MKYESLWIPYSQWFAHKAWLDEQVEGRYAHLSNHAAISVVVTPEVAERIRGHITRRIEVIGEGYVTEKGSCAGCDPQFTAQATDVPLKRCWACKGGTLREGTASGPLAAADGAQVELPALVCDKCGAAFVEAEDVRRLEDSLEEQQQ